MDVIANEAHSWFLMEQDGHLYLDVNCDQGAVGYSILLHLTAEERDAYRHTGDAAIEELAAKVQSHPNSFWPRNLDVAWHRKVTEAIRHWQTSRPG